MPQDLRSGYVRHLNGRKSVAGVNWIPHHDATPEFVLFYYFPGLR